MKFFVIPFLMMFLFLPIGHAQAQDFCAGEVSGIRDIGEAASYCSVYDRQLAYREERMEFREMLEERREDFIAPQLAAEKKYQKDLEALHNRRSHDDDYYGR